MSLNESLDEESLYVKSIMINEGPRLKRIWRRGKGRADTLLKRFSHISVTVDKISEEVKNEDFNREKKEGDK